MNTNKIFKNVSSKNYKAYVLFLILTLILWFAIQLTKSYNFQNELSIHLSNIPKHIVLDSSKQNLQVNIKSNGFKLWRYNLSSKKFTIDYNEFTVDSFQLKISANKLKKMIASKYEFIANDINLDLSKIIFEYERNETKLVPVKSKLNFNFASGYNTIDTLKFTPDSVIISGSKKDLKSVNFIATKEIEVDNVNDTLKGIVELSKHNSKIKVSPDKTEYFLPVSKYSENALMIQIKTINVPDSLELSVFPNKAKVSFLVALNSFGKVSNNDFNVICDYNSRYQQDAIMIPKLTQYPGHVLNPKLHIRKVDYLVKQKP